MWTAKCQISHFFETPNDFNGKTVLSMILGTVSAVEQYLSLVIDQKKKIIRRRKSYQTCLGLNGAKMSSSASMEPTENMEKIGERFVASRKS
jgi:hypothetical protein